MFNGRVALITGGVQGMGLEYAKELLRNGIRGVSLLDIKADVGQQIEKDLNDEFGPNRVIFFKVDVTEHDQFKDAFKRSVDHWKGLDIVINNAGMFNESGWNKCISLNCTSTVHGTFLGLEYMSELEGGKGGVILNVASVAAIEVCFAGPTYSATKSFVLSFCRGLSQDVYYKWNKVRILCICPGFTTNTKLFDNYFKCSLSNICPDMENLLTPSFNSYVSQTTEHVAKCAINIIDKGKNGSVWVVEGEMPAFEVQQPTITSLRTT